MGDSYSGADGDHSTAPHFIRVLSAAAAVLAVAMGAGAAGARGFYVAPNGNNSSSGSVSSPWRTVETSISKLAPGDTLYLRAGHYFENVDALTSGTAADPIVVRSYPGEQVTIDSGIPEFQTPGNTAWQLVDAATGEYRSTAAYGTSPVHGYVVPDSAYLNGRMVLVPYDTTADFRATTDRYNPGGFYVGPGTFVETDGHIHIRLAKTRDFVETEARYGSILDSDLADPRRYSILLTQNSNSLYVGGSYLTFLDLTFNPGKRTIELAPNVHHVRFDGITAWMGASTLEATQPGIHHVTVTRSRFYGDAPWWIFYSDMKDAPYPADLLRGTSIRLGAGTHDWEISWCHVRGSGQDLIGTSGSEYNLAIHHNRLENALDDGFELEGSLGHTEIYENLILNALSAISPGQASPGFQGPLLIYRNVIGLLRNPPVSRQQGLNSWNGGGRYGYEYAFKMSGVGYGTRNVHVYQNTILMLNSAGQGINLTPEHPESTYVANNLLVTVNGVVNGTYRSGAGQIVNGNLYWKMNTVDTAPLAAAYDDIASLHAATGLEAQGIGSTLKRGTDPQFVDLPIDVINPTFVKWTLTPGSEELFPSGAFLGAGSPARGAAIVMPPHPVLGTLPDTRPPGDMGAIPFGTPASEYDQFPFNVGPPLRPTNRVTVEYRVAAGTDDAEESASGSIDLASSDLELVYDASLQTVGLRFAGVAIPQYANVTRAYLQFQADETQSEATTVTVRGQASDQPATFTTTHYDVSSRPRTTAAVSWTPDSWPVIGDASYDERSPDLSPVVQEIVNRPGWQAGRPMVLLIAGTGHRTAESFEGDVAGAPLLHIEYVAATPKPAGVGDAPAEALGPGVIAPNPAPGKARLSFFIHRPGHARLELFDLGGRRLRTLVSPALAAGSHVFDVDGRDDRGVRLTPGVYFYRLTTPAGVWSSRFAIIE